MNTDSNKKLPKSSLYKNGTLINKKGSTTSYIKLEVKESFESCDTCDMDHIIQNQLEIGQFGSFGVGSQDFEIEPIDSIKPMDKDEQTDIVCSLTSDIKNDIHDLMKNYSQKLSTNVKFLVDDDDETDDPTLCRTKSMLLHRQSALSKNNSRVNVLDLYQINNHSALQYSQSSVYSFNSSRVYSIDDFKFFMKNFCCSSSLEHLKKIIQRIRDGKIKTEIIDDKAQQLECNIDHFKFVLDKVSQFNDNLNEKYQYVVIRKKGLMKKQNNGNIEIVEQLCDIQQMKSFSKNYIDSVLQSLGSSRNFD